MQEDSELELPFLPPMSKSSLSNFLMLQGASRSQPCTTTAVLIGWKLQNFGGLRQRKTFGLSIYNVQALTQKTVNFDTYSNPRHEENNAGSPTSSETTAVNPHYSFKNSLDSETLVNFHWSRIHLDQDCLDTFDNFGTDFTGDFAVATPFRTNASAHAPDGISLRLFGYKKSHAWSLAVTINTMVQINVKIEELVEAAGEHCD